MKHQKIINNILLILLLNPNIESSPLDYAKPQLSDYEFFILPLKSQIPNKTMLPYTISTQLFTDYAFKSRFIVLPDDEKITYINPELFDYPIGTIFIKTFYYPEDFRKPDSNKRFIETRLLIHTPEGWTGFPYIWNKDQTDANLEIAGDRQIISWIDLEGEMQQVNYLIPNFNMCKSCHIIDNVFQPIGPKPRLLNYEFQYDSGKMNQIKKMMELEWVDEIKDIDIIPATADWEDPHFSLNDRARAYLDVNCAHCHNDKGQAKTSGLFLKYNQKDPTKLGIYKTPVATGRGSGGLFFNIVPGNADESILVYRMESTDPGVLMPESGRKMVHTEGLKLIREWIYSLEE